MFMQAALTVRFAFIGFVIATLALFGAFVPSAQAIGNDADGDGVMSVTPDSVVEEAASLGLRLISNKEPTIAVFRS